MSCISLQNESHKLCQFPLLSTFFLNMVLPVPLHVAFEDLDEGLAEGLVEEGVEKRVDHGGGVAEPRDEVDHALTHLYVTRDEDVDDEEGSPTQHEGEEDHTQHLVEGRTLDGNMELEEDE